MRDQGGVPGSGLCSGRYLAALTVWKRSQGRSLYITQPFKYINKSEMLDTDPMLCALYNMWFIVQR